MNFCRLPPDRLLRRRARAAGLDVEARDQLLRPAACTSAGADPARALPPCSVRVSSVFCAERQRGHRAAAQALLGHEVQALLAALARRVARDVLAEQRDRAPGRARVLARERGHQLLLAVARDAGDADDLAGAHLEGDVRQRGRRTGRPWAPTGPFTASTTPPSLAWMCCSCGGSAPIISRDRLALRLLRRVDLAGDLAAAQHGAVVAQRADLVELVADVEDASSPRRPACAA